MKRLTASLIMATALTTAATAQTAVEGTTYYLPKTALRVSMLIEKTTYQPGQLAPYAERYMSVLHPKLNASTDYRIVSLQLSTVAIPDTAKQYTLALDKKHSITLVGRTPDGILTGINAEARLPEPPKPFVAKPKLRPLDPTDFMNEDILRATSSAKQAELVASDIYDLRNSRTELSRGEAEYMPKDGEQLRLMMGQLNQQERALLQVFEGTTVRDTVEQVLIFTPMQEMSRQVLFRFSEKLGLREADDLSGAPYYISIEDLKTVTPAGGQAAETKKDKNDINLYVNIPSKIKATIASQQAPVKSIEFLAGQFGKTENLSGELFGKKQSTQVLLDPMTGSVVSLKAITIE